MTLTQLNKQMPTFISDSRKKHLERLEAFVQSRAGDDADISAMSDDDIAQALDAGASVSESEANRIGAEAVSAALSEAGVKRGENESAEAALSRTAASAAFGAVLREGVEGAGVTIPENADAEAVKSAIAEKVEADATGIAAKAGVPQKDVPDSPGEGDESKSQSEIDRENAEHYQTLVEAGETRQEERTAFFGKNQNSILRGQKLIS